MTVQDTELAQDAKVLKPLVVDLDHSLVRTDTLVESVLALMTKQPRAFLRALAQLRFGKAHFKRAVADHVTLSHATLPYNEDILDLIRDHKDMGGEAYLVTAADQSIADGVAAHLGLFDGVIATTDGHNLKGRNKAARLTERFPDGFDYIGDAMADIPVWEAARDVYVAGSSRSVARALQQRKLTPKATFPAPRMTLKDWVKQLRIHQWSKNMLLFVPFVLAQLFQEPGVFNRVVAGFIAFGVVASATYLLNDLNDLTADRNHFGKRYRPIASGKMSVMFALVLALAMLTSGMGLALLIQPAFFLVLCGYLVVTVAYSLRLKRIAVFDVLVIGGLFTLRVFAGLTLTGEDASLWLMSFAFALFTSLALAKRHAELIRAAATPDKDISSRGYLITDTPLTAAVGVATASMAVVVMLLYMQLDASHLRRYPNEWALFLIPMVLGSWLVRIWVKAHRGILHDDPVIFALRDRVSIGHAVLVVILWFCAINLASLVA